MYLPRDVAMLGILGEGGGGEWLPRPNEKK